MPAPCFGARAARNSGPAYAVGGLLALVRERAPCARRGLRLLVRSDVPEGKGVSSSAALEVAAMQAIAVAFGVALDPRELALLCQTVENRVVGAPCGVMDQMTAACGQAGELLALLCQPAELQGTIAVPEEIEIWGLDSHVRHAVSGSDYGRVRVGAFMGAASWAERRARLDCLGLPHARPTSRPLVTDLPEEMTGDSFLRRYGGTADAVTRVDPGADLRGAAAHGPPGARTFPRRARSPSSWARPSTERRLELLGELMYQSHASYSACGLGSAGTDRLVALVREAGPAPGLLRGQDHGRRQRRDGGRAGPAGRRHRARSPTPTREETGRPTLVFSGSSPGAAAFGHLRVRRGNVDGPGSAT